MNLNEIIEEIRGEAGYEKSKDPVPENGWSEEYVDGFVDGLLRAVEIIEANGERISDNQPSNKGNGRSIDEQNNRE